MMKKFCSYQIKCVEDNDDEMTCTAQLDSGRADTCPFKVTDLKYIGSELVMTKDGILIGRCQDYKPYYDTI